MFGTVSGYDSRNNVCGPFEIRDQKDGPSVTNKTEQQREGTKNRRKHVSISGLGCALEMSATASAEGLVSVARRNGGKVGCGVTVMFSKWLEGD